MMKQNRLLLFEIPIHLTKRTPKIIKFEEVSVKQMGKLKL